MPITQAEVSAKYLRLFKEKYLGSSLPPEEDDARPLPAVLNGSKERKAQRFAIKECALQFFSSHPSEDKGQIWAKISAAHLARKTGAEITEAVAEKVVASQQSWIKSGGHAFEEALIELCNPKLASTGIKLLLQRDVTILIKSNTLTNDPPDLALIKAWADSNTFDLFAIEQNKIFACIQAKTSIRDRVTRDREPSMEAMRAKFISIVFALDCEFLKMAKFQSMVNGNTPPFTGNGWHALYAFSLPAIAQVGRIFLLDNSMSPFKEHIVFALTKWKNDRRTLDETWVPAAAAGTGAANVATAT